MEISARVFPANQKSPIPRRSCRQSRHSVSRCGPEKASGSEKPKAKSFAAQPKTFHARPSNLALQPDSSSKINVNRPRVIKRRDADVVPFQRQRKAVAGLHIGRMAHRANHIAIPQRLVQQIQIGAMLRVLRRNVAAGGTDKRPMRLLHEIIVQLEAGGRACQRTGITAAKFSGNDAKLPGAIMQRWVDAMQALEIPAVGFLKQNEILFVLWRAFVPHVTWKFPIDIDTIKTMIKAWP